MQADTHAPVTFFLTGRCAEPLAPARAVRPALFAGFRDLGALRYDFPLVLVSRPKGRAAVASLSGLFDQALERAVQGADPERVRQQALRLEQEIRRMAAGGAKGTLSALIEQAAAHVGRDAGFDDSRRRLRAALPCDGELADCDAALPQRLLRHLWQQAQQAKAQAFRQRVQRLTLKLSAMLDAEVERSPSGVTPERLQASMGPGFAEAFDFGAMSRMLSRLPREAMATARRQRIRALLRELGSQRFFPADGAEVQPYPFEFDGCAAALKAWRERLPKLAALQRALAMAELEVRGEYDPVRHDPLFQGDEPAAPTARELAEFPDYLVCITADALEGAENGRLMDILSSELPVKVLLQVDDLSGAAGEAPALRSRQLVNLALGLDTAYVVQASASHLLQYAERLQQGLAHGGPALFSVYSGAQPGAAGLPPYLLAAAAMEARVFPALVYDPAAGTNWAARFTLEGNPQPERDWPVRPFRYEDENFQGASEELAFTAVDFLAADPRHAGALAVVAPGAADGSLVPVPEALAHEDQATPERFPALWMVDAHDRLHRVLVTRSLLRQAARCRAMWHSLQELAGINNSHAQKLLAQAEGEWRERMRQEPPPAAAAEAPAAPQPASAPVAAAAPVAEAPEEPQRAPGEPYIETSRCSSCNECIQLNPKMFAYDGNKQAYIADVNAGTYAQLVEAAESCQVAVIHPGKPRKADEPGLDELLKRAEAFA